MYLKIKDNIDLKVLEKYGFKTGLEWGKLGIKGVSGTGHSYMENWYHKFETDEDKEIVLTEDNHPIIHIMIRTEHRDIIIDAEPYYTYHISEFNMTMCTLFDMINDGIVEKVNE